MTIFCMRDAKQKPNAVHSALALSLPRSLLLSKQMNAIQMHRLARSAVDNHGLTLVTVLGFVSIILILFRNK